MKKIHNLFFLFLLLLPIGCAEPLPEVSFNISISPNEEAEGMKVFISPLSIDSANNAVEAKSVDNRISVSVTRSNTGFYNLTTAKNNIQIITPIYISGKKNEVTLDVKYSNNNVSVENTSDNKALSAFNLVLTENGMKLWSNQIANTEELKQLIISYMTKADSLATEYRCSADVKRYLEISGYTAARNALSTAPRAMRISPVEITFTADDILKKPHEVLDNDLASLFYSATYIITSSIPKGTLCERLAYVESNYSNTSLKKKLFTSLTERFISTHDADNNFEAGLEQLNVAITKYGVDEKYRATYNKRRNTIVGSPFPSEIRLEDKDGNKVEFSSFHGKYVYIDLWASWCGPCVREIPHLKKMEKELKNKDVVFVSISIDSDKSAWKNKMAALELHGHQLIDAESKLGEALNIQGIPHFLIYDKEGKLHTFKAMRPSQGEPLKELLEGLK